MAAKASQKYKRPSVLTEISLYRLGGTSENFGVNCAFDCRSEELLHEQDFIALRLQYEDADEEKLVEVIIEEDDDTVDCQSVTSKPLFPTNILFTQNLLSVISGTRTSKSYQPRILDVPRKVCWVTLFSRTNRIV